MNIAIYAGSFDPITNGHLGIISQSAKLFDKVVVCIASNPNKNRKYDETIMLKIIQKSISSIGLENVTVVSATGKLIALYAKEIGAKYIVRGIRDVNDYMYEDNISKINVELNPDLEFVYLRPSNNMSFISSSFVRELMSYNQNVEKYVPLAFLERFPSQNK